MARGDIYVVSAPERPRQPLRGVARVRRFDDKAERGVMPRAAVRESQHG